MWIVFFVFKELIAWVTTVPLYMCIKCNNTKQLLHTTSHKAVTENANNICIYRKLCHKNTVFKKRQVYFFFATYIIYKHISGGASDANNSNYDVTRIILV